VDILRATLRHVAEQDFPRERLAVVLGFEAGDEQAARRSHLLLDEFDGQFGYLWASFHPRLPGELTPGVGRRQCHQHPPVVHLVIQPDGGPPGLADQRASRRTTG